MITKHWKLTLSKSGKQIVLFATTTDRMVARDLDGVAERSLIQRARQYHRRGQTPEQDHRDLAIAAFMVHAGEPPYDLLFEHIERVAAVPEGEPSCHVEGPDLHPLVPVWERAAADELDQ